LFILCQVFAATIAVSILLAAAIAYAAVRKLSHRPDVVQSYARVGVPEDKLDALAFILLAGAVGLVAGLVWAPIGIAAAVGLIAYFALAVAAHVRARDVENLPTPVVIELLAVAALVLRLATL
jgi:DoxX-like family